jgi:hypothetical protein
MSMEHLITQIKAMNKDIVEHFPKILRCKLKKVRKTELRRTIRAICCDDRNDYQLYNKDTIYVSKS